MHDNEVENAEHNRIITLSDRPAEVAVKGYRHLEFLCGRLDIFTSADEITEDNVVEEVNNALTFHFMNLAQEEYLYWYRRGLQPVLNRRKERNSFVCAKIVENHAEEICTFKNGFFLVQDATYNARVASKQKKVEKLNEYLYRSGKHVADKQIADWFHTVGKGLCYIEPNDDYDEPVKAYALDPRSAFVVYSMRPGKKPVFAVNIVLLEDSVRIDVYTRHQVFRLDGGAAKRNETAYPSYTATASSVVDVEENVLGEIPIIEYRYNSMNMAAFESCVSLLDSINEMQSNRSDGVSQFIQSLLVAVNCQLVDKDGKPVTANQIRDKGLVTLKSVGENKAEIKILSEELNQEQTEIFVTDLYENVLHICSMPSTRKGGSSTSDTGSAVFLRDGYEQASVSARNTTDLFIESNKQFDRIFLQILEQKGLVTGLKLSDIELHFVRNETINIQSKAQALNTMLASGMHPLLALAKSGVSSDPVADFSKSDSYFKMIWGDPEAADKSEKTGNGKGEARIVEEDNNNGENAAVGAL